MDTGYTNNTNPTEKSGAAVQEKRNEMLADLKKELGKYDFGKDPRVLEGLTAVMDKIFEQHIGEKIKGASKAASTSASVNPAQLPNPKNSKTNHIG